MNKKDSLPKHWGHLIKRIIPIADTKGREGIMKVCECGEVIKVILNR